MIAALLALLVTQAISTPAPSPGTPQPLPATWMKVPLDKDEYAHYARTEPDGTRSEIIASRQVCDCQPPHLMAMLASTLAPVKGVTTAVDRVTICGGSQPRFIATGLANAGSAAKNMEIVALRKEPALYTLEFTFNGSKPPADAESALAAFCP
jgi:hypothetical protein